MHHNFHIHSYRGSLWWLPSVSSSYLCVDEKAYIFMANRRNHCIIFTWDSYKSLLMFFFIYIYIQGDRMWSFGVGLFLIRLSPGSLRLVAIYGFSKGASVLLFAAIIGDWIDNTPRLRGRYILHFFSFLHSSDTYRLNKTVVYNVIAWNSNFYHWLLIDCCSCLIRETYTNCLLKKTKKNVC